MGGEFRSVKKPDRRVTELSLTEGSPEDGGAKSNIPLFFLVFLFFSVTAGSTEKFSPSWFVTQRKKKKGAPLSVSFRAWTKQFERAVDLFTFYEFFFYASSSYGAQSGSVVLRNFETVGEPKLQEQTTRVNIFWCTALPNREGRFGATVQKNNE